MWYCLGSLWTLIWILEWTIEHSQFHSFHSFSCFFFVRWIPLAGNYMLDLLIVTCSLFDYYSACREWIAFILFNAMSFQCIISFIDFWCVLMNAKQTMDRLGDEDRTLTWAPTCHCVGSQIIISHIIELFFFGGKPAQPSSCIYSKKWRHRNEIQNESLLFTILCWVEHFSLEISTKQNKFDYAEYVRLPTTKLIHKCLSF